MTPATAQFGTGFMSTSAQALLRTVSTISVWSVLSVSAWGQQQPESGGTRLPDLGSLTETALFRDIDRRIESGQGDSRLITRDGWQRDYPFDRANDTDVSRDTRGRELLFLRNEDGIDFFEDVNSNQIYASPRSLVYSSLRALPEWIRRKLIRGGRRLPIDIRPRVYLNLDTGAGEVGVRLGVTALGTGVYREQLYELEGTQANLVDADRVREYLGRPVSRPVAGNLPPGRSEETRTSQPDIVGFVRPMASDPRFGASNRPVNSGAVEENSTAQPTGSSQPLRSSATENSRNQAGNSGQDTIESPSAPDVNRAAAEARRAVEELYRERSHNGNQSNQSRTESDTGSPQSAQDRLLQPVREASRLRERERDTRTGPADGDISQENSSQRESIPVRQRPLPGQVDARPGDYYRIGTPDGVRYYDWQGNRIQSPPGTLREDSPGTSANPANRVQNRPTVVRREAGMTAATASIRIP